MTRIIAAVDGSASTEAVCASARAIAHTLGAEPHALHAREAHPGSAAVPDAFGLPVTVAGGHAVDAILAAARAGDVVAVVLGARGRPHAGLPVGHTVLGVLLGATKPVVVVPPHAAVPQAGIRRVFVPLEDDVRSARAVEKVVGGFRDRSAEIVVVHVFDDRAPLRFADRPSRDAALWGEEFLFRSGQASAELRLARVAAPAAVAEITGADGADLLVVSWSRELAPGRAAVIRRLLDDAPAPVLLVPVDGDLRP
jgi:nucleotide-binding universal stress UspA family protein